MIRSKIRKINPARSNKLIFAVAGGLALVLLLFFALVILGGGRGGRESMAKTLAYLENTEGLVAVKALDGERRAIIVFNSDSKNARNFEKIAYFAAVRLARHWPDCEVLLARNKVEQIVYGVRFRAGSLVEEGPRTDPRP